MKQNAEAMDLLPADSRAVAEAASKILGRKVSSREVLAVFDGVKDLLQEGRRVTIREFGRFSFVTPASRNYFNFATKRSEPKQPLPRIHLKPSVRPKPGE